MVVTISLFLDSALHETRIIKTLFLKYIKTSQFMTFELYYKFLDKFKNILPFDYSDINYNISPNILDNYNLETIEVSSKIVINELWNTELILSKKQAILLSLLLGRSTSCSDSFFNVLSKLYAKLNIRYIHNSKLQGIIFL